MSKVELTWDNLDGIYNDGSRVDALYHELCRRSKPSDFYFYVTETNEGDVWLTITPKLFFDQNSYSWDQSMDLEHILPDFTEEMECTYAPNDNDRRASEIRNDLLAKGFLENEEFSNQVGGVFDF